MLQRMVEAKAIFQENRQLKAVLQLRQHTKVTIATGRSSARPSIAREGSRFCRRAASDGVREGMPVRSPDGLVGRIIDVGAISSRSPARLGSDEHRPGRLLRSGIPVIAQGRGDGTVDVRPLEVGRNPFRTGDFIITSGTGGLYPLSFQSRGS